MIALRNKVEHHKDGYWADTPLNIVRADVTTVLGGAKVFISELATGRAIPQIVEPVREIRDKFGRKSYVLCLDDGTELESTLTASLELGVPYLYFGSQTNPRPVDPLHLPVSAVDDVP